LKINIPFQFTGTRHKLDACDTFLEITYGMTTTPHALKEGKEMHNLEQWRHAHQFHSVNKKNERSTLQVIGITIMMMIVEIGAGMAFGSMSLLADGWHMGTHAAALGITAFAYAYARRHADDPRYSFGTGKVCVLGGYTSAIILGGVALWMVIESLERLFSPARIQFNEAIMVAVIGLAVNLFSAFLLQEHHPHPHDHPHDHPHHDHNIRAAYLHVLADALTSLLAIAALLTGKYFGWAWMDPFMGIVGAVIISKWAYGLIKDTGGILLDREVDRNTVAAIYKTIESDSDNRVVDFHIWEIGDSKLSAIISIVTRHPKPPEYYKELLKNFNRLVHITVEVNVCPGESCPAGIG
jgi:cation diffusion facilitator family transporter